MKLLLVLLVVLALLPGCAGVELPPVEVCYVHPVYGQVCVVLGGKRYYERTLTPEQRAEVERWIDAGAPPGGLQPVPVSK